MAIPFPVVLFIPKSLGAEIQDSAFSCYQVYPDAPDDVLYQVEANIKKFFPAATVTVDVANKKVSFSIAGGDRKKALLYASEIFGLVMLSEG